MDKPNITLEGPELGEYIKNARISAGLDRNELCEMIRRAASRQGIALKLNEMDIVDLENNGYIISIGAADTQFVVGLIYGILH